MDLFDSKIVVSSITAAVFVPYGKGTPIHKNRASHGLAFNVGCESIYRFSTGEILHCHSGECVYLPQGCNYTVDRPVKINDDCAGTYAINFLILDDNAEYTPLIMRIKGFDECLSSFKKAENAWLKTPVDYYEVCLISLYKIIKIIKNERARYFPKNRTLELLTPALQYIEEHYVSENIPISHLAQLCGVSEPYLRKMFRSAFSASPVVYMRNLRIKHAKELLRSGEYSITDAAMLAGFSDTAYFSREFKKAEGISPKDYLNKISF